MAQVLIDAGHHELDKKAMRFFRLCWLARALAVHKQLLCPGFLERQHRQDGCASTIAFYRQLTAEVANSLFHAP
jgi:hypothetical protein